VAYGLHDVYLGIDAILRRHADYTNYQLLPASASWSNSRRKETNDGTHTSRNLNTSAATWLLKL
jgi:hypothetical protein